MGILVFVSYATKDANRFQVARIAETLTRNPEIDDVLYWEEDMSDDIYQYMNKNVGRCDVFLMLCSQNALRSEAVELEWMAALKSKKKIIPIFFNEKDIPTLLKTKLGVRFKDQDFLGTLQNIYQLILKKLEIIPSKTQLHIEDREAPSNKELAELEAELEAIIAQAVVAIHEKNYSQAIKMYQQAIKKARSLGWISEAAELQQKVQYYGEIQKKGQLRNMNIKAEAHFKHQEYALAKETYELAFNLAKDLEESERWGTYQKRIRKCDELLQLEVQKKINLQEQKYSVSYEEAEALEDLEKMLGLAIPLVESINWNTFGRKVENDHVIGLGLFNRGITTLPKSFGNLKFLEYLDLSDNQLTTLPKIIEQQKSLKKIFLDNNRLTVLPKSFGSLISLQELSLNSNQLTILPKSFRNLQSLQKLILKENQLKMIPEEILQLKLLQQLVLRGNQLTEIPESIGDLQSLQELDLSDNYLTTLPKSVGQLKSLQILRLEGNEIEALPISLGNLQALQKLNLTGNQLMTLPASFGKLESLQELNLSYNQLTTLPESLGNLKSLQKLDISNNQLIMLPESLSQLESLQLLILYSNELTILPDSLGSLISLQKLNLDDNPLGPAAYKIIEQWQKKGINIENEEIPNQEQKHIKNG